MSGASLRTPARVIGLEKDRTLAIRQWRWGNRYNYVLNPATGKYDSKPGMKGLPLTRRWWAWPMYFIATLNWRREGPTQRVWRNPALWDSPGRWYGIPEWVPKKATGLFAEWRQFFYDIDAARQAALIPYNRTWEVGQGTDKGLLLELPGGSGFEVLALRVPNDWEIAQINARCAGDYYRPGDMVVDTLFFRSPETYGKYDGRGGGKFAKKDGVVTAYMVASGAITTALSITYYAIQFGPNATFRFPATRVEHLSLIARQTDAKVLFEPGVNDQSVPHGTRFCLEITDLEIEAWLDRRGYTGKKRRTARIFAVCLRDYGWIIDDTNNAINLGELDGDLNPDTKKVWNETNGMVTDDDFETLLDGLFTETNVQVVKEAA